MSSIVNEKNPISILNELASKENSKIVYEFISTQEGFLAKVHYNSSQIGEGQDKKKQKAKSKAAESALSYLNSLKFIENPEMELQTLSKLLKKTGKFTLISKEPFIYEYYLDSMLISSSSSNTETSAKKSCCEKALEVLKNLTKNTTKPKTSEKGSQIEKISYKDPRIYTSKSSYEQRYLFYFEAKFNSFEIHQKEFQNIKKIEKEILNLSKVYKIEIFQVGSFCMNILRTQKKILDFVVVLPGASETDFYKFFEFLERGRLNYLKCKEKNEKPESFALSMRLELKENESSLYSNFPFIKFTENDVFVHVFVTDSKSISTLVHYQ